MEYNNNNGVLLVTASYDGTICFWHILSGYCYRTIHHSDSQVNVMQITPNKGHLVVAGNPQIKLFSLEAGHDKPDLCFDGHTNNVTSLHFQKEYRWMISSSEDSTVKLWDFRVKSCQRELQNGDAITSASLHPNGIGVATCDLQGRLRTWDLRQKNYLDEVIPEQDSSFQSICCSNHGRLLAAASSTGNIFAYKWNVGSPLQPVVHVAAHPNQHITRLVLNYDYTKLASCASDGLVKIWKVNNWTPELESFKHKGWAWDAKFSVDSKYICSVGSDMVSYLWSLDEKSFVRQFHGHKKTISCVVLHDY